MADRKPGRLGTAFRYFETIGIIPAAFSGVVLAAIAHFDLWDVSGRLLDGEHGGKIFALLTASACILTVFIAKSENFSESPLGLRIPKLTKWSSYVAKSLTGGFLTAMTAVLVSGHMGGTNPKADIDNAIAYAGLNTVFLLLIFLFGIVLPKVRPLLVNDEP